jgi:hypothetical protein
MNSTLYLYSKDQIFNAVLETVYYYSENYVECINTISEKNSEVLNFYMMVNILTIDL